MEKFTNNIIRYEENIFFLKLILNKIKKAHLLNLNKELFIKKISDDLFFINKCSLFIYENLLKNEKLINKDEHLHSLLGLKDQFLTELNELILGEFILKEKFEDLINLTEDHIYHIKEVLKNNLKDFNNEELTTNEELNILFMEDN